MTSINKLIPILIAIDVTLWLAAASFSIWLYRLPEERQGKIINIWMKWSHRSLRASLSKPDYHLAARRTLLAMKIGINASFAIGAFVIILFGIFGLENGPNSETAKIAWFYFVLPQWFLAWFTNFVFVDLASKALSRLERNQVLQTDSSED